MKKLLLLSVTFCFVASFLYAQEPALAWVKQFYLGGFQGEQSIAVNATGNVYTTGNFTGTVDIDPGPGTFSLTAAGKSIYVSKLDAAGNFLWGKGLGGTSTNLSPGNGIQSASIAIDEAGNIYITGSFFEPIDFDPGPGTFNLVGPGAYVLKLDAAGNFVWAKGTSGGINSIAVDAAGNVYTTGSFQGTGDFDPGPGTFNLVGPGAFVLKLNAAGNFVWAKGTSGGFTISLSIAVDAAGNVYTTGYFQGTVDFDPSLGTFNLTSASLPNQPQLPDIFISKLDAAGNFVWTKGMGGTTFWDVGTSIAVDASGNVYTIGLFSGTSDFDPGPGTFNLIGNNDMFISKLDAAGNFVWAKRIIANVGSLTLDAAGNVYTTGSFQGIGDFDPGPGTFNLVGPGAFVLKLDAAGNFVWARSIAGVSVGGVTLGGSSRSVVVDDAGNLYFAGFFSNTVDFDPGPGIYNLTTTDTRTTFVLKWRQSPAVLPFVRGEGCPPDSLITLSNCGTTTVVTWTAPKDSFPTTISIPTGFYPDGRPYDGEGRLTLLGTFGGHGYYRSADAYQSYNWPQANQIATSVGGHLTTITTEAENAFILSRVQSTGYFSWLGLRKNSSNSFTWVTGESVSYTNWGAQDPSSGGSEPYGFMYEGFGKWHDLVDFLLPFQVEYDAAPIRFRQLSGPANGSSLGAGVYPVCYERFNATTSLRDTCCFTVTVQCNAPTTAALQKAVPEKVLDFSVKVLPNPSSTSFTLQLKSSNHKERISVQVMDISGRLIEARDGVVPNAVLQLGANYRPGTYVVHVQQGAKTTTVRLVKQPQ